MESCRENERKSYLRSTFIQKVGEIVEQYKTSEIPKDYQDVFPRSSYFGKFLKTKVTIQSTGTLIYAKKKRKKKVHFTLSSF